MNPALPTFFDFGTLIRGDTTLPLAFAMNYDDEPAFLAAGASVLCQAREAATDAVVFEWSSAAGTALIVDGAVLLLEQSPRDYPRPPTGRFTCELEITEASGRVRSWLRGPIAIQGDIARAQ